MIFTIPPQSATVAPEGPSRAPRGPQDGPRWPQDGPRWPQDGPKTAPDGSKMAQDGPKGRPRRPKMAPRRPSEGSQSAPRPLQDALRQPLGFPSLQNGSGRPQNDTKMASNVAQEAKKIIQKCCQLSPNCSRDDWGNAHSTTLAQLSLSASPLTAEAHK